MDTPRPRLFRLHQGRARPRLAGHHRGRRNRPLLLRHARGFRLVEGRPDRLRVPGWLGRGRRRGPRDRAGPARRRCRSTPDGIRGRRRRAGPDDLGGRADRRRRLEADRTTSGLVAGSKMAEEFAGGIVYIVSGLKTVIETGEPLAALERRNGGGRISSAIAGPFPSQTLDLHLLRCSPRDEEGPAGVTSPKRSTIDRLTDDRTALVWFLVVAAVYALTTVAVWYGTPGQDGGRAMRVVAGFLNGHPDSGLPPGAAPRHRDRGGTDLPGSVRCRSSRSFSSPIPAAVGGRQVGHPGSIRNRGRMADAPPRQALRTGRNDDAVAGEPRRLRHVALDPGHQGQLLLPRPGPGERPLADRPHRVARAPTECGSSPSHWASPDSPSGHAPGGDPVLVSLSCSRVASACGRRSHSGSRWSPPSG